MHTHTVAHTLLMLSFIPPEIQLERGAGCSLLSFRQGTVTPMAQKGVGGEGNHFSMTTMGPKKLYPFYSSKNSWIGVGKRKYSVRIQDVVKRITLEANCLV